MMGLWTFLLCFVTILRLSTLISRVFSIWDCTILANPSTHPPRKFIDWYYVSFWEFSTWTNEAANAVAIGQFLEGNEWHDNVIMTLNFCTFSSIFRAYFNADDYLNLSISGHKKEHFEKTCFKIVISIDLCWLRY